MSNKVRVLALLGAALIIAIYSVSIVSAFYVPPDTPASDNTPAVSPDPTTIYIEPRNPSPEIEWVFPASNDQQSNVQSGTNSQVGVAAPEKPTTSPSTTEEQGLGTSLLGFPPLIAIAKLLLKTPAAELPALAAAVIAVAAIIAVLKYGLPTLFPKKSEEQLKKEAIQREEQKLLREIRGPKR